MADNETKILVKAATEGVEKVVDQLNSVSKSAAQAQTSQKDAAKNARDELARLGREYSGVSKQAIELGKAMRDVEQGTKEYENLEKALSKVQQRAGSLQRTMNILNNTVKSGGGGVGSLGPTIAQGVAQGSGLGEFIPRGSYREIAANVGGRAAGAGLRSTAQAAFGGVRGLAQGLAGVPVVGGFAASQLMQGTSMAELAMQQEQLEFDMAPMLGNLNEIARQRREAIERNPIASQTDAKLAQKASMYAGLSEGMTDQEREQIRQETLMRYTQERDQAIIEALKSVEQKLPDFAGGSRYGVLDSNQMRQFVAESARQAGTTVEDANAASGLMLAAQTTYGIGSPISSAFLRGSQFGFTDEQGMSGLVEAIRDAVSLGLSGSDLVSYVAQMAGDIRNFEISGLPLARESITEFAKQVASTGIAGGTRRGAAIGRGLVGGMRRIGQQGPQSAGDVLALRELGGFQGGGFDQLYDALDKLERGDFEQGAFERYLEQLVGLGGSRAPQVVYSELNRLGGNVSRRDARQIVADARGDTSGEAMRRALATFRQKAGALSDKDIQDRALDTVASMAVNLQTRAEIGSQRIAVGQDYLGLTKALEKNSVAVSGAVSIFGKQLESAVKQIQELTGRLSDSIEILGAAR